MTKEQAVYAATLELLGSVVLDPTEDAYLVDTLGREHRAADHSDHSCVDCPRCWATVRYDGPADVVHYAELAIHLTTAHNADAWDADAEATKAWSQPVTRFEGAKAA
jgi:hypothetical protein